MATFNIGGDWIFLNSFSGGTLGTPMTGNFEVYAPSLVMNATVGDFDISANNAINLVTNIANITLSPAAGSVVVNGINTYIQPSTGANIIAPSVLINNTAAVGNTRIGNAMAGNVLFIETADIQIPQNVVWTTQQSNWMADTLFGITVTNAAGGFGVTADGFCNLTAQTSSTFNYHGGLLIDGYGSLTLGASSGLIDIHAITTLTLQGNTNIFCILPTPAAINNTPLLIDTDGRIHV